MTVYVDHLRPVKFRKWGKACHMLGDTDEELENMAARLRLHPDWRHRDHYDLTEEKRRVAIIFGAREVTARRLARIRKERK